MVANGLILVLGDPIVDFELKLMDLAKDMLRYHKPITLCLLDSNTQLKIQKGVYSDKNRWVDGRSGSLNLNE